MAKIDLDAVPVKSGSRYPAPYDNACKSRRVQRLGDAGGLTHLGVTRLVLPPGGWSSQRHWHSHEDEFMLVFSGEVVLITDAGEELMRAGDTAAFQAGDRNGHHVQNRSSQDAVIFAFSSQDENDGGEYPDIDLKFTPESAPTLGRYLHKDGTPY